MNAGVRASALSATATVALVALIGVLVSGPDPAEAGTERGDGLAEAIYAPPGQEAIRSGALLSSVRGLPAVACRLLGQSLENRWGRSGVAPWWSLPGDGGPEASREVAAVLGGEVSGAEAEILFEALGSSDDCERLIAAHLVVRLDDQGVSERLSDLVSSGQPRVRVGAAMALGFGAWSSSIAVLTEALRDADVELRQTSAWALGRTEDRDAVAPLTQALGDSDVGVRANAVVGLGWIESTQAIDPLEDALGDASPQIRVNAAWAMGQIESTAAIPALTALLGSDSDPEVRRAAAWALGRIE